MKHRRLFLSIILATGWNVILTGWNGGLPIQTAQAQSAGEGLPSYAAEQHHLQPRSLQYQPTIEGGFMCMNGQNRYTRALYGSPTDWRLETSDRPVFAVVKKNHHRNISFMVGDVALDATDYCSAIYINGTRKYTLRDPRWGEGTELQIDVVALPDEEGAVWLFQWDSGTTSTDMLPVIKTRVCPIANPRLKRNGDIGADAPGVLEAAPDHQGEVETLAKWYHSMSDLPTAFVVVRLDEVVEVSREEAASLFERAADYNELLAQRITFSTPDPYINTLGSALSFAADGDWDGQTWLHGCIGWRMPLAGWRAAYAGDVLGWPDRARCHFDAYARSQVTNVEPTLPHPTQDTLMNMARAEKRWGTQMYSNGYICRNPGRNDQMHHYDMNLNYVDELLWHFQFDADTAYMRQMWPLLTRHLAWEKRNYDADGDHLYDAYCCIWARDALYYSGGAVTHSSAYNYRANLLCARIAEILGEDPQPYAEEADAILKAMNRRLWLPDRSRRNAPFHTDDKSTGHWAEYQDGMGLKRVHDHPGLWSIYTPIDCGACSPSQAQEAADYVSSHYARFSERGMDGSTIATTDWMPYDWSINNVAAAETMHTALALFEAGRIDDGYRLLKGNIMDQMYYGQSPANFGQLSYYDAARGECYRDFGDCIGISSRALIQGLFGIVPNALYGECIIRPSIPLQWDSVSIQTPYLSYTFSRRSGMDVYHITQNFARPLKIVYRGITYNGQLIEVQGTDEREQTITVETDWSSRYALTHDVITPEMMEFFLQERAEKEQARRDQLTQLGLDEPDASLKWKPVNIVKFFNAEVDDIFKNAYLSPRPQTTTLQIPVQGVGEWCNPKYTPTINDSVFRTLVSSKDLISISLPSAGGDLQSPIPFATPRTGHNIIYTSLFDNYPDEVTIPLKGRASAACLLTAGSTNHMQCYIDNAEVIVTYADGTTTRMPLTPPYNWCPIEQDYYIDGHAFQTLDQRPYRVCLGKTAANGQPIVSRDLGQALGIKGASGREIPGGGAQLLCMPLDPEKKLKSLTLRTLSNDVVIGLMAVTLQQ